MTEILASCSKLCDINNTKVQATDATSIIALAGVPLEDISLILCKLNKEEIFCSTLDAASMYALTADSIAIIPTIAVMLCDSLEINPDAVARGAREFARTWLPVAPINEIFKNIYINPVIIMVILIDLYTIFSAALVSWAGIALTSKPVIGK